MEVTFTAKGYQPGAVRARLCGVAAMSSLTIVNGYQRARDETTVYPSLAGGFPPASFLTFADALGYVRTLQGYRLACGICTCPAASYAMHYRDTLPR